MRQQKEFNTDRLWLLRLSSKMHQQTINDGALDALRMNPTAFSWLPEQVPVYLLETVEAPALQRASPTLYFPLCLHSVSTPDRV